MWRAWDAEKLQLADHSVGVQVRRAVPQFSQGVCDLAVAWVFYQYYLR